MKRLFICLLCVIGIAVTKAELRTAIINGLWYMVDTENRVAVVIKQPQNLNIQITFKEPFKGKMIVPEKVEFYTNVLDDSPAIECTVVGIGPEAFMGWDKMTTVELPDQLQFIDQKAFAECNSLKRIDIPASVDTIGAYAFANCKKLRRVRFANSLGANAHNETWFVGTKATVESVLMPGESVSIY